MVWGKGWRGPWPGNGPWSHLPPWERPGWRYGRGWCWQYLGTPVPESNQQNLEIEYLKQEKRVLEEELKNIEERLKEIEENLSRQQK